MTASPGDELKLIASLQLASTLRAPSVPASTVEKDPFRRQKAAQRRQGEQRTAALKSGRRPQ